MTVIPTQLLFSIEGQDYALDLARFGLGVSVFIPCASTTPARFTIAAAARRVGVRVKAIEQIENGLLGLRVWRIR